MKLRTFSKFTIYIIGCVSIISCSPQNDAAIEKDSFDENVDLINVIEKNTTNNKIVADSTHTIETKNINDSTLTDLNDSSHFSKDSYNDIYIGDKFNETLLKRDTEVIDNCFNAVSNIEKKKANYQIENGLVAIIYTNELGVESYSGVKIGSSLEDVYSKHANETPEVIDNPYGESGRNIVLIYWYSPEKDSGIRYDVDDDIVTGMSIGNTSLLYMEGCL